VAGQFFNPFPKYLQIRDILIRRLGRDFDPGDRIPTEHALTEEFGVSRETVREALRGLEEDGLIRRRRGQGTFVVKLPDRGSGERLTGLVEDFTQFKLNTEVEVLETAVTRPSRDVAAALHLRADEPVYRLRRLRFLDSEPLAHHDAILPLEVGVQVARFDLRQTTLFHEIGQTLGYPVYEDYQHIDAAPADAAMAELLGVGVGAPLLVTRRVFGVNSSGPAMFFESHFRSDRYYYTVHLTQPQRRRHTRQQSPDQEGREESRRVRA
jgi:GntR family transcriptional regulator